MLETINAITDTYEDCEELLAKLNSDCRSFFGGGRLSAIFETTSLDIWNVELYAYVIKLCYLCRQNEHRADSVSLEIPACLVM